MPKARARPATSRPALPTLPTPEESASAVKEATRRLGLLLDLHRVAMRLREIDQAGRIRSST